MGIGASTRGTPANTNEATNSISAHPATKEGGTLANKNNDDAKSTSAYPPPKEGLPDGLSSSWLTGLFRHHKYMSDATELRIARVTDIYLLNGIVFRIEVTQHGKQADLPSSFVLKITPDWLKPNGKREALFYNTLMESGPFGGSLTTPRSYWAVSGVRHCCQWLPDGIVSVPDEFKGRRVTNIETAEEMEGPMVTDAEWPLLTRDGEDVTAILMEDVQHDQIFKELYDRFSTPGTCNLYFEEAKLVLKRLARVHAAWWDQGDALRVHEELQTLRPASDVFEALMEERGYGERVKRAGAWAKVRPLLEPFPALAARYDTLEAAEAALAAAPHTLLHGDFTVSNFKITGESVCLFDWAEINVNSAACELDNFIWRCGLHNSEKQAMHIGFWSITNVKILSELLQAYYRELTYHGVDAAAYPFKALVEHFVAVSVLSAMGDALFHEAPQRLKELAEEYEACKANVTERFKVLQALCTKFLKES